MYLVIILYTEFNKVLYLVSCILYHVSCIMYLDNDFMFVTQWRLHCVRKLCWIITTCAIDIHVLGLDCNTHNHYPMEFCNQRYTSIHSITSIHQDSPTFTNIHQHSPRFTKIHQDSPRFTKIHQDSPRFTKIHQDSPRFPKIPQVIRSAITQAHSGYTTMSLCTCTIAHNVFTVYTVHVSYDMLILCVFCAMSTTLILLHSEAFVINNFKSILFSHRTVIIQLGRYAARDCCGRPYIKHCNYCYMCIYIRLYASLAASLPVW